MTRRTHCSEDASAAPAIAGAAGRYRETLPAAGLRRHFQCVWTSELAAGQTADVAVLPDGCVDVLWRDGALRVVGPDVTAAHPVLAPGARVLGARFRAGAAQACLGAPMSELVGREVALEDLWGPRARGFERRMQDAGSARDQQRVFQEGLALAHADVEPPDARAAELFRLCSEPGAEAALTARIRDGLEMSERSLRRLSHAHFGYGAKTLERIMRLQYFLALARQSPAAGLAALAAAAHYADQAHLTREVQALCGMTPAALRLRLQG
ncbi:DUF6597 domain-containing transcriptional factor [Achromobacter sp. NPDC058515]|uniref:DUF6597 domain-containing transcriptional factor n=1 Tax=Achromobacter sp. NPDC058515 TaxID=3346533 RepID=UPI00364A3F94